MLETLKARKEALEARGESGFTLMEMLIVIAIIAILIAIAIPVFSAQLEKAREATDMANIRAAYAEAMADFASSTTFPVSTTSEAMTQADSGWDNGIAWPNYLGSELDVVAGDKVKVEIAADGTVTCSKAA